MAEAAEAASAAVEAATDSDFISPAQVIYDRETIHMEYIAFISYRHLPLSAAAAEKLAVQIEQFVIPKRLRRDGQRRLGRVFRDRDELPLSGNLTDDLYRALDQSEYLIVVCTPEILQSRYCIEEIRYFLEKHDREHVLTVLASGTPDTSFPPVLLTEADPETGEERNIEPLAADITAGSQRESLKKLKKEKLRLIAPMLGCRYDDLVQRMKRRRRRKALTAFAAVCAAAAVFSVFAVRMNRKNLAEREMRIRQEAMLSAEQSRTYLSEGLQREALEAAVAAFPQMPDGTTLVTPEGVLALSDAGRFCEAGTLVPCGVIDCREKIYGLNLAPDGRTVTVNGTSYDAVTLEQLSARPGVPVWTLPDGEKVVKRDEANDRILLDTGEAFTVRRLSDGEQLGTAAYNGKRTALDFTTTLDGAYSCVLHYADRGSLADSIYNTFGNSPDPAVIDAFGTDGSFFSYEVPFDLEARLMSSGHFCVYACEDGLYLVDPACKQSGHEAEEALRFYSFAGTGYDTSSFLPHPGKKTTLLFGADFAIAFDTEKGPVFNWVMMEGHGTVRACAWTDETEKTAVILMSDGYVCHYYDDRDREKYNDDYWVMQEFNTYRISFIKGTAWQDDPVHSMDQAQSADEGPVRFAAVSADEPQIVRLYTILRNDGMEFLSLNNLENQMYDFSETKGYYLRWDGWQETENRSRYTLLYRGKDEPRDQSFMPDSSGFSIVGLAADGKWIYTYDSVIDPETGEARLSMDPALRDAAETRGGNISVCARDSRGAILRMMLMKEEPGTDKVMHAVVMRDDQTAWEGDFPLMADAFFNSTTGDQTEIGRNGWARTPVRKQDGSPATVLTDLYGERFNVIDTDTSRDIIVEGTDTSSGTLSAIGINPDRPVLAMVTGDTIRIVNCADGSTAAELPMPVPGDTLRNVRFLQDDRFLMIVQNDMTVVVVDASDGSVLFRRATPEARMTSGHLMLLHVYEKEGEITYSFRNEGYRDYSAGYTIDTDTWQIVRTIPRLYSLDYPNGRIIVLDPTLTRCYLIPLMTAEEMLEAARSAQ